MLQRAITLAAEAVFPGVLHRFCWFHVRKKRGKLSKKEHRHEEGMLEGHWRTPNIGERRPVPAGERRDDRKVGAGMA